MNHTLKQIGFLALSRLLNSARFRPQNKEDNFQIVTPETDFELEQAMKDSYCRDHDSSYRAGQSYAVWGIELGYRYLDFDESAKSYLEAIIKQTVPDTQAPLPSHFIVCNWSNSDYGGGKAYNLFRLNNSQDEALRRLQEKLPAAPIPK